MDVLHAIALFLITLFSFSTGAVATARESAVRPALPDVVGAVVVGTAVVVWTGELAAWLSFPIGIASGVVVGAVVVGLRRALGESPGRESVGFRRESESEPRWRRFLNRIGNFQARLFMTLLYFTLVAPFALIARLAQDPLNLEHDGTPETHWRERGETPPNDLQRPY